MTIMPQLERDLHTAARTLHVGEAAVRPRRRWRRIRIAHVVQLAAVLVALAVAAAFLSIRGRGPAQTTAHGAQQIVLTPSSANVSPAALARDVPVLRARLRATIPGARIIQHATAIVIELPRRTAAQRALVQTLIAPGRLRVYDWEASVLTTNAQRVARALPSDPDALLISQGDAAHAPGSPHAGALPLAAAVVLARHSRPPTGTSTLIRAIGGGIDPSSNLAGARYYVLQGAAVLTNDVAGAHASVEPAGGSPAVTITLTPTGGSALHATTARLAFRGQSLSGLGQTLNQHIAFALDGHLLSVWAVDFRSLPDGIAPGAVILLSNTGLTDTTARALAAIVHSGPLAVDLQAR
jgi:hypothetical protein